MDSGIFIQKNVQESTPFLAGPMIIMSHLGRPKGQPNEKMSLAPVAKRLSELLGQDVVFVLNKRLAELLTSDLVAPPAPEAR